MGDNMDYSATGQPTGYVNPAYPSTDPPPNYGPPMPQPYGQPQPFGHPAHPPPYGQPAHGKQAYGQPQTFATTTVVQNPGVVIRERQTDSAKGQQLGMGGAILAIIIGVLLVVGIATSHWGWADDFNYGLWKVCYAGFCVSTVFGAFLHPIWYAIQGFAVLGTLMVLIGVILHCVMGFTHAQNKRALGVGAIVMYSLAIFCLAISLGLFGGFTYPPIVKSWSFYLTVVATIGCVILAILAGMARGEYAARGAVFQSQPVALATIS